MPSPTLNLHLLLRGLQQWEVNCCRFRGKIPGLHRQSASFNHSSCSSAREAMTLAALCVLTAFEQILECSGGFFADTESEMDRSS